MLNVFLASSLIALYLFAGQPPQQLLDKASNYLAYQRTGTQKKVGVLLLRTGLASDWNAHAGQINTGKAANPLRTAASTERQFPYQQYDEKGKPEELHAGLFQAPQLSRAVYVNTTEQLLSAIKKALPGDVINVSPGHYRLSGRSIPVSQPGTPTKPIYVRSARLGSVVLELNTLEGFHIKAPYWVFENLDIRGHCDRDSRCEHAFHVTGQGRSFTLRNSKLNDFNAAIKVNGANHKGKIFYPDNGLIEYNQFVNTRVRDTANPVSLLNINSVDYWVVRGNFIADFSKSRGNHTSYGAYMKGGGSNGIIERNLVICEHRLAPDRGIRIGLSFGGGGIGEKYCRHGNCAAEHSNGIMRNNIVLNCSRDVGIYLRHANNSLIYSNLLHNTLGIDVRYAISSATIVDNIISGRIKERDGAQVHQSNNLIDRNCLGTIRKGCSFDEIYAAPDVADIRLKTIDKAIWGNGTVNELVGNDFCGNPRSRPTDLGPIQYSEGLSCLQP